MAANLDELKQVPKIIEAQRRLGKIDEPSVSFFFGACKLKYTWIYKAVLTLYVLALCYAYAVVFALIFSNIKP